MSRTSDWSPIVIMFSLRKNISRNIAFSPAIRIISTSANCLKSHYDVLGVTPSATQGDIKAAYYKKSMKYHPDKNKGCEDAAKRFRDITEAYEVLGNLRLRKLYDKGVLHTVGPELATGHEMKHGEEKFYNSREHRSKAPSSGRTTIYNFDAWTNEHYGRSFVRRGAAKARYEEKLRRNLQDKSDIGNEFLVFASIVLMFTLGTLALTNTSSYDNPITKKSAPPVSDEEG